MKKVDCALRFKEIETEEECNQLAEILDILDIKFVVERKNDVNNEISYIKEKGTPSERSLPFDFYDLGLQAYIFGFDMAAIIYCFSAVELMLTLLLKKKENLNYEMKIGLNALIREAFDRGLLDEKLSKITNNFRVLRNDYVHFVNHAEYFNELYRNAINLAKIHLKNKERARFMSILDEFYEIQAQTKFLGTRLGRIRFTEMRRFLDWNEKRYQKWCESNQYDILRIGDFDFKRIRHVSIQRFNALSAIGWTSKILRKLEKTCID